MKKDLFGTRFKRATETSANPAKIRTLRRSIARVNTVLLERRRAASQAQTAPAARATAKSGRK
jgi:ribosomal protein L29